MTETDRERQTTQDSKQVFIYARSKIGVKLQIYCEGGLTSMLKIQRIITIASLCGRSCKSGCGEDAS